MKDEIGGRCLKQGRERLSWRREYDIEERWETCKEKTAGEEVMKM